MKEVDIYIDTDIKGPRRRPGHYLYIIATLTSAGPADTGSSGYLPDTTENQATLTGLETALKRLREGTRLTIHLECPYVASALENGWYRTWREHGWMNARNRPVCDDTIWRSIESLLNAHVFEVRLKEPHTYREWMRRTLQEKALQDQESKTQAERLDKVAPVQPADSHKAVGKETYGT